VFPNSRRIVITDVPASQKAASVQTILAKSGLVDEFIPLPPSPRKIRDFFELRKQIRRTNAKLLIYVADRNLLSTLRDLSFFRTCGIKQIIGAPLQSDLRHPRVDPETGYTEREASRLTRCLASLGTIDLDSPDNWDLRLREDELAIAHKCLTELRGAKFIVVNIGGKVEVKDWGEKNWTTLLGSMGSEYPDLALVLVGSADEFNRSARLAAVWAGSTLNLCGRLGPRESAAVMKSAVTFVGHDSGPLHLAAAIGVPCVGLFGNFNKPKWWHPVGNDHCIIHNMRGVQAISVKEVRAAAATIIGRAISVQTLGNVPGVAFSGNNPG
jgi:ADP-heptose:LPS heptosyltransferase